MNRAALYLRVSDTKQQDNYSLPTQEERGRAYCAERGYAIAGVYTEVHSAGEHFRNRPALTQLRQDIRDGLVDVLVVYALDRFVRNQAHLYLLIEELEEHGARLECVTEAFEMSAEGKLLRSVHAFRAEVEREKIIERTTRGMRARIASGKPKPGPRPPFGLRWRDEQKSAWDVDPLTGPLVTGIGAAVLAGRTMRSICADLMAQNIPTPTGRRTWYPSALSRMLANPVYVGKPIALRASGGVALPDGTAPELFDPPTWEAIQDRLRWNQQQAARNNRHPEVAGLRGMVYCGLCGYRLAVAGRYDRGVQRFVYECYTRNRRAGDCKGAAVNVELLDDYVWTAVLEALKHPERVATHGEEVMRRDHLTVDLVNLDRLIAGIDRQQANLIRELTAIDDDDVARLIRPQLAPLAERRRTLAAERERVAAQVEAMDAQRQADTALLDWLQTVARNLGNATYEERVNIFRLIELRVTVYPFGSVPRTTATALIRLPLLAFA